MCIYLPRHYGDTDDGFDAIATTAIPLVAEGQHTVMVVDDEPTIRMLVPLLMSGSAGRVTTSPAPSGCTIRPNSPCSS